MHILLYNINIRTQLIFRSCDPLCVLIFDSIARAYNELWIRIHRYNKRKQRIIVCKNALS